MAWEKKTYFYSVMVYWQRTALGLTFSEKKTPR